MLNVLTDTEANRILVKRFATTVREIQTAIEAKAKVRARVYITDDGASLIIDVNALPPVDLKLRQRVNMESLTVRADLVTVTSHAAIEIDRRVTAEHNKQSKEIAKKEPKVAGYYDDAGRPSELLNKLAAGLAKRHGLPSGGVVKPTYTYPVSGFLDPPKGSRAEAEAEWKTKEFEDFANAITAVAKAKKEQEIEDDMIATTSEQMDMIIAATSDVNANLILFPSEPEQTAIWSSVQTAAGEPYELPNEIDCSFFRLIYKFRDQKMVLHIQQADTNEPTLSMPFDVLEDALPVLHKRLEEELQSGGFFGSLKELNAAAAKLVNGRKPIGNALEDSTYKTVTAATAKRDQHKQVVENNHYAENPLYGSL